MPTVYKCSRCGNITESKREFQTRYRRWWRSYYTYDLCSVCDRDLEEFLKGRPVWTQDDDNAITRLKSELAAEKEVSARWERLAREDKDGAK